MLCGREVNAVAEGTIAAFYLARRAVNELLGPIQELWRFEALRRVRSVGDLTEDLVAYLTPASLATTDGCDHL